MFLDPKHLHHNSWGRPTYSSQLVCSRYTTSSRSRHTFLYFTAPLHLEGWRGGLPPSPSICWRRLLQGIPSLTHLYRPHQQHQQQQTDSSSDLLFRCTSHQSSHRHLDPPDSVLPGHSVLLILDLYCSAHHYHHQYHHHHHLHHQPPAFFYFSNITRGFPIPAIRFLNFREGESLKTGPPIQLYRWT